MDIYKKVQEIIPYFVEVAQPKSNFVMKHFVVGQHVEITQQWVQCVIEIKARWFNLRRLDKRIELALLDRKDILSTKSERALVELEIKDIDLEEMQWERESLIKEMNALLSIFDTMPKFTAEQIEAAQEDYWRKRITNQTGQDLIATHTISQRNLEALRQLGLQAVIKDGQVRIINSAELLEAR